MTENSANQHIYRVDKYVVPTAAQDEITARLNALITVLRNQQGLVSTSAAIHLRSSSRSPPDASHDAFSSSLTTTVFNPMQHEVV